MKKGVVFFFSLIAFSASIFSYSNSEPDVYSGVTWLISGDYETETGLSWWENGNEESDNPEVKDLLEQEKLAEKYKQSVWDSFEFTKRIPIEEISDFANDDLNQDFSNPFAAAYRFITNYINNNDVSEFIAEDERDNEDFEIGFDKEIQKLCDYKNIVALYFSDISVHPVYGIEYEEENQEENESNYQFDEESEIDDDTDFQLEEEYESQLEDDTDYHYEEEYESEPEDETDEDADTEIETDSQNKELKEVIFIFGLEYVEGNQIKKEISSILLSKENDNWLVTSVINNLLSFWAADIPENDF